MVKIIRELHKFLERHSFYPIVLSSLLASMLFSARVLRSDSMAFRNLVWNLLLAWVPYLCSMFAASLFRLAPRRWWVLLLPGALWLLFFPNAPYIVTDFLHLEPRRAVPLWYDILLLATYAWTGLFMAVVSLRTMQHIVESYLGLVVSWLFASVALALGGLGIYLGRFSRFNSWDLMLQPKDVLKNLGSMILNPMNNLQLFGFTLLFSAFLWVVYLTFVSIQRNFEIEK